EMVRVRFEYPGRARPILDDVSLAVPAGCTTALVGSSGAGKTTIASLFLRFWDPGAGAVRLSGRDLKDYRLDELRGQVARVVQDALAMLARDRTTLVIAHRLSTVRDADQIIVLDAGRVVETGSHETLVALGGLYARLVSRQFGAAASPRAGG